MKDQNGITLVALTITIIVILILVGVSISSSIEENGLLAQANNAKQTNYEAAMKEKIDVALAKLEATLLSSTNSTINRGEIFTEENLNKELEELGKVKENSLIHQDDGWMSFIFIANENNKEIECVYKSNR